MKDGTEFELGRLEAFRMWALVQRFSVDYDEDAQEFRDPCTQDAWRGFSAGFAYGWDWR